MNNNITIPTGVNFGNRPIKSQLARIKKKIDDMPSATELMLKNWAYRVAGGIATTVGGKGLYDGYRDEADRGLHSPDSICRNLELKPGVFVEAPKGLYDTFVEQVVPLLPCHVSLPHFILGTVGFLVMRYPTRSQFILAYLNDRVPKLFQQGAKRAKMLANNLRRGS